jgi:hypothetical protein
MAVVLFASGRAHAPKSSAVKGTFLEVGFAEIQVMPKATGGLSFAKVPQCLALGQVPHENSRTKKTSVVGEQGQAACARLKGTCTTGCSGRPRLTFEVGTYTSREASAHTST